MQKQIRACLASLAILLLTAQLAFGAAISVVPSGNGVFTINGENMDGIAGIELLLSYDPSAMSIPTVTQGSLINGALMAANTNKPGSIKIGIATAGAFSGSGTVAVVSFSQNKASGNLVITSSNTINASNLSSNNPGSHSLATEPPLSNYNQPGAASTGQASVNNSEIANSTGVAGGAGSGSITLPSNISAAGDTKTPPTETPEQPLSKEPQTVEMPLQPEPVSTKTIEKKQEPELTDSVYLGVLDRFRDYKGERSLPIFRELFKEAVASSFTQEPVVALSDGKTVIKVTVLADSTTDNTLDLAVKGAKLLGISRDKISNKWFITLLPDKDGLNASVIILNTNGLVEYPLTIAPQIAKAAKTEAEFAAYLKSGIKPLADSDYIYTANFLVQQNAEKTKK